MEPWTALTPHGNDKWQQNMHGVLPARKLHLSFVVLLYWGSIMWAWLTPPVAGLSLQSLWMSHDRSYRETALPITSCACEHWRESNVFRDTDYPKYTSAFLWFLYINADTSRGRKCWLFLSCHLKLSRHHLWFHFESQFVVGLFFILEYIYPLSTLVYADSVAKDC